MRKTPTILVGIVLLLLALGIVMLASASSVKGNAVYKDANYFLFRQLIWLVAAAVAGVVTASIDYHQWQRWWIPISVFSGLLLVLVLVPGIGAKINGSHRWIRIGPISTQPSELAKFALVIMMSAWMTKSGIKGQTFKEGILKPLSLMGIFLILVIVEPDFGTTVLLGVVGAAIMFTGGSPGRYLVILGLMGALVFGAAVMHDPIRAGRVLAFMDPDKYPKEAYHLQQSEQAFTLGGVWGVGLGESLQKHFYLPEAHTDFILAIIGEELGLAASILVVLLFSGFLACGAVISFQAPDLFGRLMGTGFTLMTAVQAAINIGVVSGCLPTKGLALPFISYGGSSLIVSMMCVGVLVNIARQGVVPEDCAVTRAVKDNARWM
ncbi:MAG: putative lipid II flippase FtsW [bacterium]|jgi:cell division protein FtsW